MKNRMQRKRQTFHEEKDKEDEENVKKEDEKECLLLTRPGIGLI